MKSWALPVTRPVATSMFFLGLLLLGGIAWWMIPVELVPPIGGDQLFVDFGRPGSDPEVLEREILLPLAARLGALGGVEEHWGEIRGSMGNARVRFEPGVDLKMREIDLRRLAADLAREQPLGSWVEVSSQDLGMLSQFVMFVQVTGLDDRIALLDLARQRIIPRLASVAGVSRVESGGAEPLEMAVHLDPGLAAAQGVASEEIEAALVNSVRRIRYLGRAEGAAGLASVVLDGRPRGPVALGDMRVSSSGVALRHVARVHLGAGREEMLFRVNSQPTVALVIFQEQGSNLVRLGRSLRERFEELRGEFQPQGIDFVVNFDAADVVERQLRRLQKLALSGFLIALAVLYLFLRQIRAVAVVGIAVPASLLTALALLFLAGHSLNLITLFGLAVGIGMLVDNSIVVYEAVQRRLEQGASSTEAAADGVRRTLRAILAASVTNAVVFLPIVFVDLEDVFVREFAKTMALAILLPLAASLIVAVGLVPLLSHRLAAGAALARIAELRARRDAAGGLIAPDRGRELFGGLLRATLRRPAAWLTIVAVAVVLTVVIALPLVAVGAATREAAEAEEVRFSVRIPQSSSLDQARIVFERLEASVRDADGKQLEGVRHVESVVREDGGTLTVHLQPLEQRSAEATPGRVRERLRAAALELEPAGLPGVELNAPGSGGGGAEGGGLSALLGGGGAEVVISGPGSRELDQLAKDVANALRSVPEVASAEVLARPGLAELHVLPDASALSAVALTSDQVLANLRFMRREGIRMPTGFVTADGRELPLVVRREETGATQRAELAALRVATPSGVLPLAAVAQLREMPPPAPILHHNGRREVSVNYRFGESAPASGPARLALEERVREEIRRIPRPAGYGVELPDPSEDIDWFRAILIPVVLLLFAVLAVTFESLTLPLLVLISLPLTVLGATWALLFAGMPADAMALLGVLALIGLTVNPAILLVDRMQERARCGGLGAGAAALAAVRERARPVLMTTATTVAGLWPLALATGAENEIWPPFATVLLGGLVTSTLLTLLVIPVGFVFLHRLDRLFGRLGPWILLGWAAATSAVMAPLISSGALTGMTWRIVTTVLVAALLLGAIVVILRRLTPDESARMGDATPVVRVRCLSKIYGRPGPVGRAWRSHERFAKRVLERGGRAFDTRQAWQAIPAFLLGLAAAIYLSSFVTTIFWRVVIVFIAAQLAARSLRELRRARGRVDELGRVLPGGVAGWCAAAAPWLAWGYIAWTHWASQTMAGESPRVRLWVPIALAVGLALIQAGRRSALRQARGALAARLPDGRLARARSWWRRWARRIFGLDLPSEEVRAVRGVQFEAVGGMIGVLGPNGAGKTTLLRQLAGILDPSVGRITLGGLPLASLRRHLARHLGYLPQEFGLPADLTARQYLDYHALLYEIAPPSLRRERVQRLLDEVGLAERADERIGTFSGGMRQRVAVARTLLRLPPVIIVDEPTVGLDPRERIRFRNLLAKLAEGRTVFFSTHVVEDVAVACERVLVMARGRLVFDGEPHALSTRAQGRVWEMWLAAGEEKALSERALIVDQVPDGAGGSRCRVLAATAPSPQATPLEPTLEDGYFWLVREGEAA